MLAKTGPNGEPNCQKQHFFSKFGSLRKRWLFLVTKSNNYCKTGRDIAEESGRAYSLSLQICVFFVKKGPIEILHNCKGLAEM